MCRTGKKLLLIFLLVTFAVMLLGCGKQIYNESEGKNVSKEASFDEKVDKILSSMSQTEKIGQMMMIGIHGTDVNEDSLFMLHQYHFGGIILFDRNMKNKEQVALLNQHLQEQCEEKISLFIAVDEEGGSVARMKEVLIPPKSQLAIGETGNPENAYKSAYDISLELKKMGFNVNFAPVADLGSFKDRHFSADPDITAEFLSEAAKGYEDGGMIYCLKHFPGIGKGKTDSHDDSVVVDISRDEILKNDIIPFKKIISERDNEDFMVMISHVTFSKLDKNTPSSISSVIMKDLLRDELNYQGLIITDDMEMGAIAKHYGYRRAAVEAVKAGADIVLMCHEYQHAQEAYEGLLEALENGEISKVQIDNSVRRIIRTKYINFK